MSEADIKLKLGRLIDSQEGDLLRELYELILDKIQEEDHTENLPSIEQSYKAMSEDLGREEEAFEWIEGTLS